MSSRAFVLFGPDHVAALGATAIAATGLSFLARHRPEGRAAHAVRFGLAAFLLLATAATLFVASREAPLTVWDFVPLHLCDFLILVAAYALVTRRQAAYELLYFWAGTGTALALATPDVSAGFPDWRFLSFFCLHGGVVTAGAVLAFGYRMRPSAGAVSRVFILTNAYAAFVALVDYAFRVNFLFLRGRPSTPTLLDWFGPWPYYLVVTDLVALALFALLDLPFRRSRGRPKV